MRASRLAPLLALTLLAAKCKDKKPEDTDTDVPDLPPPSVKLQVAGIDPAFATAGAAFDAEVFGSAFERGADVRIGSSPTSGVDVRDENQIALHVPPLPAGSYDVTVENPDGTKATLRKGLTLSESSPYAAGCPPVTVHFDHDSTVLTSATRAGLDAAAACMQHGMGEVRVEGHCDEQGTTDYNLALGQRRADAVTRYLAGVGVIPTRLRAISFGEERPLDVSQSATAWAANRRAEVLSREPGR